jgi:hypothetical protein
MITPAGNVDRAFTPTSTDDWPAEEPRRTAEVTADGEVVTTLAFSKASPSKIFGETLGCGKGPSHGLDFTDVGDGFFEEPPLLAPDSSTFLPSHDYL